MPRRKKSETTSDAIATAEPVIETAAGETSASPDTAPVDRPAWIDGPPTSGTTAAEPEHGKNWGDPYKSIFSCPDQGFELGENRRFRQRVFKFGEKPAPEIVAELKENGFVYRSAEKAWTIVADAETRKLTDELARKWAGPGYVQGMER